MIQFVFCVFLVASVWGEAAEKVRITSGKQLFDYSKKHSLELNKIQKQLELDELSSESLLNLYRWKLTGSIAGSDAEVAPTSPFAPAGESDSLRTDLRLEKKTALGITPYAELNATSAKSFLNIMPTPINIEYKSAFVEVGARFDIMKLVFAKNAKFVYAEIDKRQKISEVSKVISERVFEKNLLYAHFDAIKANRNREILTIQCGQYNKLRSIMKKRYDRKLIREKDFLLVEVLYQQCLLDLEGARNNYRISLENLKKKSGLFEFSFDYTKIKYPNLLPIVNLNTTSNKDLALSELIYEASFSAAQNKVSLKLPEFNFDLALRSEGSDVTNSPSYSEALSQAFEGDFLTTEFGLSFSHNFGGSARRIDEKRAAVQSYIDKTNLEQLKQSLRRDMIRLGLNLSYFDTALRKIRAIENLQKRKSEVFNKEFQNGQVAIRDLVEAEVAYLSSLTGTLNIQDLRMRAYIEAYDISGASFEKFY